MNKLLCVLLAGFFAAGAFSQTSTTTPSTSGSVSGSLSGSASTSNNTNNNAAISANANTNTNTNTNTNSNTVNVYGPGSNKLARQQGGISMMPHGGTTPSTGSTLPSTSGPTFGMDSSKACPPGLAKKDNGCMPPGLTRSMGASGSADDAQKAPSAATSPTTQHPGAQGGTTHHRRSGTSSR